MDIRLTEKEFRRLIDLVYVGNWIMNSVREEDRFEDYDRLEEKIFSFCEDCGMKVLVDRIGGHFYPSRAYVEGGIHEAIMDYEDAVFFEILAEELARRDMNFEPVTAENMDELNSRMDEYISEFEKNGVENLSVEK